MTPTRGALAIGLEQWLRSHLDSRVKIHVSLRASWSNRTVSWEWWIYTIFAQSAKMKCNGSFNAPKGNINRSSGCHTTREIRH